MLPALHSPQRMRYSATVRATHHFGPGANFVLWGGVWRHNIRIRRPDLGLDYFFITKEVVQRREEVALEPGEEGEEEKIAAVRRAGIITKCLLVRCISNKTIFAHVVLQKGGDEEHYCAKLVVSDLEWLGHACVILTSYNESAIVALRKKAARLAKLSEAFKNVQEENPVS